MQLAKCFVGYNWGDIHPKIAQERLGHSSITVTLDLYSHVTENMQTDAASKLDAVFRLAMQPVHEVKS